MKSNVKYIILRDGCMPEYETIDFCDTVISHDSRSNLSEQLARQNMRIIVIQQGLLAITDDASYALLNKNKRISVLYKEITPSEPASLPLVI